MVANDYLNLCINMVSNDYLSLCSDMVAIENLNLCIEEGKDQESIQCDMASNKNRKSM